LVDFVNLLATRNSGASDPKRISSTLNLPWVLMIVGR